MKKQKQKNTKVIRTLPVGVVITDLVLWTFTDNEEVIRHNVEELSKALLYSFHLDNFGPTSFGLNPSEESDE